MPGISGVSNIFIYAENINANREALENLPGSLSFVASDNRVSEGTGKVHKESNSHSVGNLGSPAALQDFTETDEFSTISKFSYSMVERNSVHNCTYVS